MLARLDGRFGRSPMAATLRPKSHHFFSLHGNDELNLIYVLFLRTSILGIQKFTWSKEKERQWEIVIALSCYAFTASVENVVDKWKRKQMNLLLTLE